MAELQGLITQAKEYADEIEVMHVEHTYLNIKIKELDDACEYLQETKEKLDEQKKATDEANEDLEKQLKAKEEANQKRLIAKLQRDRNPEIKELIQKEEAQQELNEDFNNKFREEKEKHDELLDQLVELRETLKRRTELMQETKLKIEAQDELGDVDLRQMAASRFLAYRASWPSCSAARVRIGTTSPPPVQPVSAPVIKLATP